jgi:PST family polysaccharide transporter
MAGKGQSGLVKETILGTIWVYAANYSGKALVFISTLILARLLTKADYGLAGYALVVIGFLDVLVDLGVGAALIYYPETENTRNTAFWLNVITSGLLFGLTYLMAPLAGEFFNDPRAVPLTRVMALTFPISALGNIHASLLAKHLTFKKKFVPDITKALGKGLVSILLAYFGFGAWSLVLGQVGGTALGVIAFWLVQPWRPKFAFDPRLTRPLLKYGVNIVAVDALGVTLNNLDYLFVGRVLGAEALGVYTLAFRIPELLVKNLVNLVGNVLFPAYSRLKDDLEALQKGFIISMQSISMFTIPVALGLVAVARPMILTLFTDKWEEAIPVTSLIAVYTLIRSLTFNIGNLYKAQGKPEILTKLSFLKIPFLFAGLWRATTESGTIVAVAWVQVGVALISAVLNIVVAARVLSTPVHKIVQAFQPALVAGLVMLVSVTLLLSTLSHKPEWVQLVVGILAGMLVYAGLVFVLQRDFVLQARANLKTVFDRS